MSPEEMPEEMMAQEQMPMPEEMMAEGQMPEEPVAELTPEEVLAAEMAIEQQMPRKRRRKRRGRQ